MRSLPISILAMFAAPAHAEETRSLRVVNDTSSAVNQLFVTGERAGGIKAKVRGIFGASGDARDRLDAKMLPRGAAIVVALKGERCRYDLRAVLEDGRSYVAEDYDVCACATWSIASGTRR